VREREAKGQGDAKEGKGANEANDDEAWIQQKKKTTKKREFQKK